MFSQFLRRPALAIVISIIILFLGGLSDYDPAYLAVSERRAAERHRDAGLPGR